MWINVSDKEADLISYALSSYFAATGEEACFDLRERLSRRKKAFTADPTCCIDQMAGELVYGEEGGDFQAAAFEKLDSLTNGSIHYDQDTIIARDGAGGAYVMGWIHISDLPDDEDACRECGEHYADGGDGYNGRCPDCADKAEQEGRSDD
jgi:hypothetical protein